MKSPSSSRYAVIALMVLALALPGERTSGSPAGRAGVKYSPYPEPDSGYVTDIADLLSPDQEERIEWWLWQAESRTGIEIIVVTIRSRKDYPEVPAGRIETFAKGLFNKYRIGNMPANDGVLLLVSGDDREARIELGAHYGSSANGVAEDIMQGTIVPRFRKGDYAGGITRGVEKILLEFANLRVGLWKVLLIYGAGIVISLMIAVSLFRNGKRGWGWVCVGIAFIIILVILKILRTTLRHLPVTPSGSWGSGGMGGFGGGFSGGGGATGRW